MFTLLVMCLVLGDVMSQENSESLCPYKACNCTWPFIYCEESNLDEIPALQNTDGRFTFLNLAGNNISFIEDDDLPSSLVYLDLRNNPIQNISKEAFRNSDKTLKSIKFFNAEFDNLPGALESLENLHTLYIGNSSIEKEFPKQVLAELAKSVTDLTLENVGLKKLPQRLNWFSLLRKLDLSNNEIKSLSRKVFVNFALELNDLNLRNTGLSTDDIGALQDLKKLQRLDLSKNNIDCHVGLTYYLIPFASTLEHLIVSGTNLTQLPRLEVFNILTTAFFTRNKISSVSYAAFPTSLVHLDLGYNEFSHIPTSVKSLPKLKTLSLHNNQITSLGQYEFPVDSVLQSLDLHGNKIVFIDEHAFANVQSLTYLNLDETTLTRLPLALSALDKLSVLSMQHIDELVCTCIEVSLAKWIRKSTNLKVRGQCKLVDIGTFLVHLEKQC